MRISFTPLVLILLAATCAGCSSASITRQVIPDAKTPVTGGKLAILPDGGTAAPAGSCQVNGHLPDHACSPGALATTSKADVCTPGWAGRHRNVPESEKLAVYAEYGITQHSRATYEMDHIVSLELGGDNNIANLYPESATPLPGYHEKDRVENYLHREICAGRIDLATAQREIATNWVAVYKSLPAH